MDLKGKTRHHRFKNKKIKINKINKKVPPQTTTITEPEKIMLLTLLLKISKSPRGPKLRKTTTTIRGLINLQYRLICPNLQLGEF